MLNSSRERMLAWTFGGSLLAVIVAQTFGQLLLRPLDDKNTSITAVRGKNSELQGQVDVVDHAVKNLKQMTMNSLPADPGKASVLYQGWLIRRLNQNSINSAIVTPGPPIAEKRVGYRIPFSIQGEGTSTALAQFLDEFYATPLLHRVTNMNVSAGTSGNQAKHRLTMSLEALALESAYDVHTLPEPGEVSTGTSLAAMMMEKDLFGRVAQVSAADTFATVTSTDESDETADADAPLPARDPRSEIRFVASVWNGRQREAWFVDHRSKSEQSVSVDGDLRFPNVKGRVLHVGSDFLTMEIEGRKCALRIGQTLDEID